MDSERRPVILVVANDDAPGGRYLLTRDKRHAGGCINRKTCGKKNGNVASAFFFMI
jgi:hypothetical protein